MSFKNKVCILRRNVTIRLYEKLPHFSFAYKRDIFCFNTLRSSKISSFLFKNSQKGRINTYHFIIIWSVFFWSFSLYFFKTSEFFIYSYEWISIIFFFFLNTSLKLFCISQKYDFSRYTISWSWGINCLFEPTSLSNLFVSLRCFWTVFDLFFSSSQSSISPIFKSASSPISLSFAIFVVFLNCIILLYTLWRISRCSELIKVSGRSKRCPSFDNT